MAHAECEHGTDLTLMSCPECDGPGEEDGPWSPGWNERRGITMKRFTAYRPLLSQRGTHNQFQRNADDAAQYEGVIFTDGSVAIRWLTSCHSTSLFATLMDVIRIHGHPEYGTKFVWHDCEEPKEWADYQTMCMPG